MTGDSSPTLTTLGGIAAILQAVAWPCVAVTFYLVYRAKLASIFDILILKLKEAKRLKAGQIEIDTEREIHEVVRQAGEQAASQQLQKEIPEDQLRAAQEVGQRLSDAPMTFSNKLEVAHRQIYDLVNQYETIRQRMKGGPTRTRMMNEIAAQMRALAIAAHPFLQFLVEGEKAAEHLAAICILQVRPELGYFDWLVERVMREEQPFLFFHASLAILELVKALPQLRPDIARESIQKALNKVRAFGGGQPDQNTIDVLEDALSRLKREQ